MKIRILNKYAVEFNSTTSILYFNNQLVDGLIHLVSELIKVIDSEEVFWVPGKVTIHLGGSQYLIVSRGRNNQYVMRLK